MSGDVLCRMFIFLTTPKKGVRGQLPDCFSCIASTKLAVA